MAESKWTYIMRYETSDEQIVAYLEDKISTSLHEAIPHIEKAYRYIQIASLFGYQGYKRMNVETIHDLMRETIDNISLIYDKDPITLTEEEVIMRDKILNRINRHK